MCTREPERIAQDEKASDNISLLSESVNVEPGIETTQTHTHTQSPTYNLPGLLSAGWFVDDLFHDLLQ